MSASPVEWFKTGIQRIVPPSEPHPGVAFADPTHGMLTLAGFNQDSGT